MSKLVIAADSHQLSTFQRCPQAFDFSAVHSLESLMEKKSLTKGTFIHKLMALYYRLRRRGFGAEQAMFQTLRRVERYGKLTTLEKDQILFISQRFMEYVSFRSGELVKPLGIEVGFSLKLFEDKNFVFIYEGKIDLIAKTMISVNGVQKFKLCFWDHKSRSSEYTLDTDVNQFFGYAWALRKTFGPAYEYYGLVNYFGLQTSKDPLKEANKIFDRPQFQFTEAQIFQWEKDTIFWFQRIAQARSWRIYPRSWQCSNNFGLCEFKPLCSEGEAKFKDAVAKTRFRKREKQWSAWE